MRKTCSLVPLLLAFLVVSSVLGVAQNAPDSMLTNAGVAKMVKAGLPESVIMREIAMSRTNFDTSPAGLVALRKRGASENVLNAVLDSWNSGGMPMPVVAPGGDGASGPHMAGFKANVRINKKVHENIAVGHNHVEVQGSGIPAISVEWQTNPSDR
jgi:hypothetical protein